MSAILNITNGDCAVEVMQQAGIPGVFLPWRDVLHDGPVPGGLPLEELSGIRAAFIRRQGWGTVEKIRRVFVERDEMLRGFAAHEKVILWFEHDLYDQLQLLQILDWFCSHRPGDTRLTLICSDRHLGELTPAEMADLRDREEPVTEQHLQLACKAWRAFCASTPENWRALLDEDIRLFPFLKSAVLRLLEEYPGCADGLSRTARQALEIIRSGERRPGKIFRLNQKQEAQRFMGDLSFWAVLQELLDSSPPLLRLSTGEHLQPAAVPNQELRITPEGEQVLDGRRNWLDMSTPDRWIGGVHLAPGSLWCWDTASAALVKRG